MAGIVGMLLRNNKMVIPTNRKNCRVNNSQSIAARQHLTNGHLIKGINGNQTILSRKLLLVGETATSREYRGE